MALEHETLDLQNFKKLSLSFQQACKVPQGTVSQDFLPQSFLSGDPTWALVSCPKAISILTLSMPRYYIVNLNLLSG
jgi:hypothetical protein